MVSRPWHGMSLCAGGGGLDLGVMLAEPVFHTRAFVKWEDWPRTVIIAAQRAGCFAPAPIWDDLRSFNVQPFHGAFDIVRAGYPWARRIAADPEGSGAAAAEPALGRLADGLAFRARALRLLGNGVPPLAAAHAWPSEGTAHGLEPVDRAAIGPGPAPGADGFP